MSTSNKTTSLKSLYSQIAAVPGAVYANAIDFIRSPENIGMLLAFIGSIFFGPYLSFAITGDEAGYRTVQIALGLLAVPPLRRYTFSTVQDIVRPVPELVSRELAGSVIAAVAFGTYYLTKTKTSVQIVNTITELMNQVKQTGASSAEAFSQSVMTMASGLKLTAETNMAALKSTASTLAKSITEFFQNAIYQVLGGAPEAYPGVMAAYPGTTSAGTYLYGPGSYQSSSTFVGRAMGPMRAPQIYEPNVERLPLTGLLAEGVSGPQMAPGTFPSPAVAPGTTYGPYSKTLTDQLWEYVSTAQEKTTSFLDSISEKLQSMRHAASQWFSETYAKLPEISKVFGENTSTIAFVFGLAVAAIIAGLLIKRYYDSKYKAPEKISQQDLYNFGVFKKIVDDASTYIEDQYKTIAAKNIPAFLAYNTRETSGMLAKLSGYGRGKFVIVARNVFSALGKQVTASDYVLAYLSAISTLNEAINSEMANFEIIGDPSIIAQLPGVRATLTRWLTCFSMIEGQVRGKKISERR